MTWIVKLGGSLEGLEGSNGLRDWLQVLVEHGAGKSVIVPGGGRFVDHVREAQRVHALPDVTAHHMAILGMQQYGLLLCGLQPGLQPAQDIDELQGCLRQKQTPLWMPAFLSGSWTELPRDWTLSSDSLALRLAQEFPPPRIVLVKASLPPKTRTTRCEEHPGIVDQAFPRLRRQFLRRQFAQGQLSGQKACPQATRVLWLGAGDAPVFRELLAGRRRTAGTELLSA